MLDAIDLSLTKPVWMGTGAVTEPTDLEVTDEGAVNDEVEEEWLVLEVVDVEVEAAGEAGVEVEVDAVVETTDPVVLGSDVDSEVVVWSLE